MTDLALHSNGDHSMCDHPVERQISEELISVIRERTAEMIGRVGMECLSALADRGTITYRGMPTVAERLANRSDFDVVIGQTIDRFQLLAGIMDGGRDSHEPPTGGTE